jgi:hypothetical protein
LLSAFSRSGLVLLTTDLDRAQYNKGS